MCQSGWTGSVRPARYAAVRVGEVAKRAGVTTGAIYHQFESKAGLFRTVYDELVASTSAHIAQERLKNPTPSLIDDCELYLDACADPAFFRITADGRPSSAGTRSSTTPPA